MTVIRVMQLEDHAQLEMLWRPEDMESSREYLQAVLGRNPDTCFVVEENGRILAAACGLYDGRRGFVQSVAVLPDERGKGYGSMVVRATVDALLRLGTKRIRLFVKKSNGTVPQFYEKLGFEIHDSTYYMGLKTD
ncbi:MAG TPA: GNAT family N-acetyltransferase [Aggregatilineales bacterium]|nr:GNAT family N-acetyltransferase [Aggregatilineales bacterium]